MKTSKNPIEYRNETDDPRIEGYFYGRHRNHDNIVKEWPDLIKPFRVFKTPVGMMVDFYGLVQPVTKFHWFGPVTEVREG